MAGYLERCSANNVCQLVYPGIKLLELFLARMGGRITNDATCENTIENKKHSGNANTSTSITFDCDLDLIVSDLGGPGEQFLFLRCQMVHSGAF